MPVVLGHKGEERRYQVLELVVQEAPVHDASHVTVTVGGILLQPHLYGLYASSSGVPRVDVSIVIVILHIMRN
jgi:hypothetical protein